MPIATRDRGDAMRRDAMRRDVRRAAHRDDARATDATDANDVDVRCVAPRVRPEVRARARGDDDATSTRCR
jgi:hypothetical protein